MHDTATTEAQTPQGPSYVNPLEVIFVSSAGEGSSLLLTNGIRIASTEPAKTVAERLWRFLKKVDNGYFNKRHVRAVVSTLTGCELRFAHDIVVPSPLPATVMAGGLRLTNAQRNAIAGEA